MWPKTLEDWLIVLLLAITVIGAVSSIIGVDAALRECAS